MNTKITSTLFSLLLISTPATASTEHEREVLNNLLIELQALDNIIHSAEQEVAKKDRQKFNYEALRHDLSVIERGINKHLYKPRFDPRELPKLAPITGDYH